MPKPNSSTVGIIIPCKNHGKYLKAAIDSVLLQDHPVTICIVNDKSTDDSEQIARSLFTKITGETMYGEDSMVTGTLNNFPFYLINKDKCEKQAKARNIAIKVMWDEVDYFCQLDADDYYLENKLKKNIKAIESDPYFGLVYNDVIVHNILKDVRVHELRPAYDRARLEVENIISNAPLVRKEVFQKVGLYNESLPPCEDWDMWLRITESFGAIHIPEPLQVYTITGENCFYTIETSDWNKQVVRIKEKLMERKNATNK